MASAASRTIEGKEQSLEARIDEEYKIWKKNAPLLYDVVITHALDWPSLTVQWLPVAQSVQGGDYVEHKLLLGTHVDTDASADRNYLQIATVRLPTDDAELKVSEYDEERGELGGYGGSAAKIEITMRINHPTEVHRARYCPANAFLIATKTASPDVLVFDYSRHPTKPVDDRVTPLLRLSGHTSEGYGLAWSTAAPGQLLSGSDDGLVCAWDVLGNTGGKKAGSGGGAAGGSSAGSSGGAVAPLFSFLAHGGAVIEDVSWHNVHPSLFGTASDDGAVRLWDARSVADGPTAAITTAHTGNAMCVAFHPSKEFLVASGGTDKVVRLWDARAVGKPLHTLAWHEADVLSLAWSPFSESHLASSSADRRVNVWDINRIGQEQEAEDAEDGPPELLFIHGGHTDRIADFSWNEKTEWFFASVSDDNIVQIWQPASTVIFDDEDGGEEDAEETARSGGGGGGGGASAGGGAKRAKVADADLE